MEKQEAARQKQLADAKARQARQVADAATRPEFKKWIDDDMIERNARLAMHLSGWTVYILYGDMSAIHCSLRTQTMSATVRRLMEQGAAGGRSSRGGEAEGGGHSKEGRAAGRAAVAAAGAHGVQAAGSCCAARGAGQHQSEHPGSCLRRDWDTYALLGMA